ncbi:hypothetical protein KPL78_06230 [Roseomonas sp. HJA6]|uniref:DUF4345 domain-containing protein n=1 Tax=Roseomonas alba TaxID=2846776 RepID=A0ABS7A543_9PROT|nr:hypothetical protein [Neoroseomonas alba]MBW6397436.1 hypothetical protein [Neoroseomonas alba]
MRIHAIAAAVEVATGLALAAGPGLVAWLILGQRLSAEAALAGRILGIGLTLLALACWRWPELGRPALLLFQLLVALPLAAVAIFTPISGPLLWPAILYHLIAWALLARRR